jgi:hypothetical protein
MMQVTFFGPKRVLFSSTLLAVLAAFSTPSSALQPLITDDTGTQGAGGNQLEVSFNRERTRTDGEEGEEGERGKTERVRSVPVAYTYGVTETLDVYGGVEHARIRIRDAEEKDSASGFVNTVIGAKWRFFENEASGTSLAIKPEVALPVSSQREKDGLGTGRTSGSLTFILSQDLPFGSVHFNAGVGRDRFRHSEDNPSASIRHFSVAPVWDISEQWKLALDVGVDRERSDGHTVRTRYSEIAASYAPSENLEFALGYIRATDDEHPKSKTHGLMFGLTWCF